MRSNDKQKILNQAQNELERARLHLALDKYKDIREDIPVQITEYQRFDSVWTDENIEGGMNLKWIWWWKGRRWIMKPSLTQRVKRDEGRRIDLRLYDSQGNEILKHDDRKNVYPYFEPKGELESLATTRLLCPTASQSNTFTAHSDILARQPELVSGTNSTAVGDAHESQPDKNTRRYRHRNGLLTRSIHLSNTTRFAISSKILNICLLIATIYFSSCEKFVKIPTPTASLVSSSVFANSSSANQAQMSIYSQLCYNLYLFNLSVYTGLSSDEFTNYSTSEDNIQLYQNSLLNTNANVAAIWSQSYNYIFQSNAVLEGINASTTLDSRLKQQLKGEAEFTRAFMYFQLVNLFGSVPLVLTTNYNATNQLSRSDSATIYKQIISDLKDAQNLLSTNFVGADGITTSSDRLRPTKWAATALLARVHLFSNDWSDAFNESSSLISNTSLFGLVSNLNNVFKSNSTEAIWQTTYTPYNTYEGYSFILTTRPSLISIDSQLLNSFEMGDQRMANWIGKVNVSGIIYSYPFKYQNSKLTTAPVTEYNMVLRLAEQYLICAESQANGAGNGINGAIADLNIIRNRAGLVSYSGATDKASLLNALLHERRVELFSELGHRWFDLKRTSNVDMVMQNVTAQKGGSWKTTQKLYPIPQTDRAEDNNLTQNEGY